MIFRRGKPRSGDPNQIFREARAVMTGLLGVIADMRVHLDELEAELHREPDPQEVQASD